MAEINISKNNNDTIKFSPEFLGDDDIDIQLTTPKRRAPKRKGRKPKPPPPMHFPEPMDEDPMMDAFINPSKHQVEEEDEMSFGAPHEEEEYEEEDNYGYPPPQQHQPLPTQQDETIDKERIELLNKFSRLEAKGVKMNQRFTAYSDINDMRHEYQRLTYASQLEASIKFQRRVLMAGSTGIEFCNKRFNPFDVELDGWSENVMENIDEYDNIFEELFVKYRESVQVAPEIRLLMTLGGSAMMFHFTKTMFQAAMPSMNDVVKQNPDLVRNMVNAVAKTAQNAGDERGSPPTPGGRREMQGPDIDMSSLFSSLMPMMGAPPPQVIDQGEPRLSPVDDDIESLISSVESVHGGDDEIKNVPVDDKKKKKKRNKTKVVEI